MSSPFALTAEEKRQLEVGYKKPPPKRWNLGKKKTTRVRSVYKWQRVLTWARKY
jgi:hypothetical protein